MATKRDIAICVALIKDEKKAVLKYDAKLRRIKDPGLKKIAEDNKEDEIDHWIELNAWIESNKATQ